MKRDPRNLATEGSSSGAASGPALDGAVARVLESRILSRSPQLKRLLVHLLDAHHLGDDSQVTETAIGTAVFQRRDFNPKVDTIVRSEMVRLRRKLDEFYRGEAAAEPYRLAIDRNVYRLLLLPNVPPKPEPVLRDRGFWKGVAACAALVAVAFVAMAFFAGVRLQRTTALPASVLSHPLWAGFRSTQVDVLEGSPLFFKYRNGYERNLGLNFAQDVAHAKSALGNWPAIPVWDKWTAFADVGGAVLLDRFLRQLNSTANLASAHERSIGSLASHRTIILGHPRFAPLEAELLAPLNFHAFPEHDPNLLSGFVNAHPRPGELQRYLEIPVRVENSVSEGGDQRDSFLLSEVDESTFDYGLITSVRLETGGEVLSLFGDRIESVAILLRQLTDPVFLEELNRKVFAPGGRRHRSAQIVVRIDYNRRQPTGVEYLTHRVQY